eukprot:2581298-Prymnesium_polylepis.1
MQRAGALPSPYIPAPLAAPMCAALHAGNISHLSDRSLSRSQWCCIPSATGLGSHSCAPPIS